MGELIFARDSIYAIARICYRPSVRLSVCLSVCLSVTRVDHSKTLEVRIMQLSPLSSPMTLVSSWLTSPRNSKGNIKTWGWGRPLFTSRLASTPSASVWFASCPSTIQIPGYATKRYTPLSKKVVWGSVVSSPSRIRGGTAAQNSLVHIKRRETLAVERKFI